MNITVKKPVYSKQQTPTGVESMHTFELESDWTLQGAGQSPAEALPSALEKEKENLNVFLTEFLRLTAQYFAKPYSVATITKTLKHATDPSTATGSMTFQPKAVQINPKGFLVQWTCKQEEESTLISLPDMDEEEAIGDIDEIPSAATNEVIQLQAQSPNIRHIYDRQRVKEANLRAKLAQYKANRAHLEYLEKYGEAPSDSSDSEPDDSDESE
jgi:hypothetical protein